MNMGMNNMGMNSMSMNNMSMNNTMGMNNMNTGSVNHNGGLSSLGMNVSMGTMPMNMNNSMHGMNMGPQFGGNGMAGNFGSSAIGGPGLGPMGVNHKGYGLRNNQQGILGNAGFSGPDAKYMRQDSGGLLGRPGNHGNQPRRDFRTYGNQPHNRQNRQINRGRSDHRGPSDDRQRHDSRDSRDNRDSRSRYSYDRRDSKRDDNQTDYQEKRQVAVSGDESLRVSVGDGQEEYDPAEPTEDTEAAAHQAAVFDDAPLPRQDGPGQLNAEKKDSNVAVYHAGQKRPRSRSSSPPRSSSGDLKVTVNKKGRSVQDGPTQAKRHEVDPQKRRDSVTSVTSVGSNGKDRDGVQKFTCHACSVDCKNLQHFESHMRSARHRARMDSIRNLHLQKTDQQLARMRAEEHLRRIEGRDKEDHCRICDKKFVGSFIMHRRGQEHRRKERLTKRGCKLCKTGCFNQYHEYVRHIDSDPHKKRNKLAERPGCNLCGMTFRSPKTFVAHCKTDTHKQKKEELRKQEQNSSMEREDDDDDDDVESFPDSLEELVTVDATGIYQDDDEDVLSDADDRDKQFRSRSPESDPVEEPIKADDLEDDSPLLITIEQPLPAGETQVPSNKTVPRSTSDAQVKVTETKVTPTKVMPTKVMPNKVTPTKVTPTKVTPTKVTSIKNIPERDVISDDKDIMEDTDEMRAMPDYNPEVATGQEYVVPVSGFFCKLCRKFFNNEHAACVTHCQARLHYNKYAKALEKTNLESSISNATETSQDTASTLASMQTPDLTSSLQDATHEKQTCEIDTQPVIKLESDNITKSDADMTVVKPTKMKRRITNKTVKSTRSKVNKNHKGIKTKAEIVEIPSDVPETDMIVMVVNQESENHDEDKNGQQEETLNGVVEEVEENESKVEVISEKNRDDCISLAIEDVKSLSVELTRMNNGDDVLTSEITERNGTTEGHVNDMEDIQESEASEDGENVEVKPAKVVVKRAVRGRKGRRRPRNT